MLSGPVVTDQGVRVDNEPNLVPADQNSILIEASFCAAIRIAREQKSVSLEKRAQATYTEYRRQKASASEGRGFRLPFC